MFDVFALFCAADDCTGRVSAGIMLGMAGRQLTFSCSVCNFDESHERGVHVLPTLNLSDLFSVRCSKVLLVRFSRIWCAF